MRILVNGEQRTIEAPCTIKDLLADHGLANAACAVEVNRKLVPRRAHHEHLLADGDQVEIVTLVGGG